MIQISDAKGVQKGRVIQKIKIYKRFSESVKQFNIR